MKLPNYEKAFVAQEKITEYLLSVDHPDGQSKATFFMRYGFTIQAWEDLALALIQHAADGEVIRVEPFSLGTRYAVEGLLVAPDGRTPLLRSVWVIDTGTDQPRLITAFPRRRRAR